MSSMEMTLPALLSPTISPGPKEVMVNNEQHGDDLASTAQLHRLTRPKRGHDEQHGDDLSITDCKDKKQKKRKRNKTQKIRNKKEN